MQPLDIALMAFIIICLAIMGPKLRLILLLVTIATIGGDLTSYGPHVGYALNSFVFDGLDCNRFMARDCNSMAYQFEDKVIDNIVRAVFLAYKPTLALSAAMGYRLVGEYLYLSHQMSRSGLVYFPNLFDPLYFGDLFGHHPTYYLAAIGAKMGQEVYLHYSKK
jgi:hypothetical protein